MSHKSIAFGKIKGPKKIESYNSFKNSVMEYTFKKNYTWTSQLVLLHVRRIILNVHVGHPY